MQTIELPSLAEHVRNLPAEGAGRNRELQRLVDLYASAEAAAALHAAAARTRDGLLGNVLTSAEVILDRALSFDDAGAHDRLRELVVTPQFSAFLAASIRDLREAASSRPDIGACTIATALALWSWTIEYFAGATSVATRPAANVVDELVEALCPLIAARTYALDVEAKPSTELQRDFCHVYSAHASALAGAACAELVFGYRRHLLWDAEGCATCFAGDDLDDLEAVMPGIASGSRMAGDVVEPDGSHPMKEGPCVRFNGVDSFTRLRSRLDGCLTGARIAKDRAAAAIARSSAAATPSVKSKGKA